MPAGVTLRPMTNETIGQRVRRAREAKQLHVNDLDREIGSSPGYVSRVENDQFNSVGSDKLIRMAEVLDVSLDWLMRGEGTGPVGATNPARPGPPVA